MIADDAESTGRRARLISDSEGVDAPLWHQPLAELLERRGRYRGRSASQPQEYRAPEASTGSVSLGADAVAKKSAWSNQIDDVARPFSLISDVSQTSTKRKAPQLGGQEFPSALAVCLGRVGAAGLASTFAAEPLSVDPVHAPFFKKTAAGAFETVRILHPDPARPFNISIFCDVPSYRLKWPPEGDQLRGEWVTSDLPGSKCYHAPVKLTEDDLKGSKKV